MSQSRIPSPARSQGAITPRRAKLRSRSSRSVGSPARSTTGRLSAVIQFKENNKDSFALSPAPSRRSVLNDDTYVEEPRRRSWWKKLADNSRDVMEVLSENKILDTNEAIEEYVDIEVLSQEKKNYTLDLPDSSDGKSISSIVIPQRKLFTQKDLQTQNKFSQLAGTRETLAKLQKSNVADKSVHVAPKNLFNKNRVRTKPVFPTALLNISADKTINKTKEMVVPEPKVQVRPLFGNRAGTKRKNMFADFIVSDSEEEIPDIQPKVFGFPKKPEPVPETSRPKRNHSPTSSITTDIEMDEWQHLPSSTMVENQIEDMLTARTPVKRARLSKLEQIKESEAVLDGNDKESEEEQELKYDDDDAQSEKNGKTKVEGNNTRKSNKPNDINQVSLHDGNASLQNQNDEEEMEVETEELAQNINKDSSVSTRQNISKQNNKSVNQSKIINTSHKKISNVSLNKSKATDLKEVSNTNRSLRKSQNVSTRTTKNLSQSKVIDTNESKVIDTVQEKESETCQDEVDHDVAIEELNKQNSLQEPIEENIEVGTRVNADHDDPVETPNDNSNEKDTIEGIDNAEEDGHTDNEIDQDVAEIEVEYEDADENINEEDKEKSINEKIQSDVEQDPQELTNLEDPEESDIQNASNAQTSEDEVEEQDEPQEESEVEPEESEEELNYDESEEEEENEEEVQEDNEESRVDSEAEVQNESGMEVENEPESGERDQSEIEVQNESAIENDDEVQNESAQELQDDEVEDKSEVEAENDVQESDIELDEEHLEADESIVEAEARDESNRDVDNESNAEEQDISVAVEDDDHIADDDSIAEQDDSNIEAQDSNAEAQDSEDEEQNEDEELQYESDEAQSETENNQGDSDNEIQDSNEHDEIDSERADTPNETHDTTGRNRKKHKSQVDSPEAILHDDSNQIESFVAKGRNTSIRKTTMLKNMTIRPSMAPPRESTGISDGTRNSSAEGSGWDSHRVTKKTLRQTFGRDFTPRKSLRALVMEKSAKRQTAVNDVTSVTTKFPQANSTELPEASMAPDDDEVLPESNHDVSKRTRQTTLELYLQKIKKQNIERKMKLEEEVRNSLKAPQRDLNPFKVPSKPMFSSRKANTKQTKPKAKPVKSTLLLGDLPNDVIEDMKYKPPKRFQPSNAPWITKRLYKFLESKLESQYDYKARVRAEKLVASIYQLCKELKRAGAAPAAADELKREMARLGVVKTHFDFYQFFHDYMPREIRVKVVPDIVNKLGMPRHGVFSEILRGNTVQG